MSKREICLHHEINLQAKQDKVSTFSCSSTILQTFCIWIDPLNYEYISQILTLFSTVNTVVSQFVASTQGISFRGLPGEHLSIHHVSHLLKWCFILMYSTLSLTSPTFETCRTERYLPQHCWDCTSVCARAPDPSEDVQCQELFTALRVKLCLITCLVRTCSLADRKVFRFPHYVVTDALIGWWTINNVETNIWLPVTRRPSQRHFLCLDENAFFSEYSQELKEHVEPRFACSHFSHLVKVFCAPIERLWAVTGVYENQAFRIANYMPLALSPWSYNHATLKMQLKSFRLGCVGQWGCDVASSSHLYVKDVVYLQALFPLMRSFHTRCICNVFPIISIRIIKVFITICLYD